MRHEWYGNDRDLVKWGALVHLAEREQVETIIQVAMRRPDGEVPPLKTSRGQVAPPDAVAAHFRNLEDIARLGEASGVSIEVLQEPFTDRRRYFARVADRVRASREAPVLLFLDPDIGLVAERPGPEYVSSDEVASLFEALHPGDLLVCYQHGRRHKDWRGQARRAFANAPGLPSFDVEVVTSERARDVLMLAVRKPS
mgnify:CR=1 FL=1